MGNLNEHLTELGRVVQEHTERGPDTEHTLRFVKNRLRLTIYARADRSFGKWLRFAPGMALLIGAVAATVFFWSDKDAPLTVALESQETPLVGQWIESKSETKQLRFSDGTQVALGPETRLRVSETTPHGGRVVLDRGRAIAQIVPRSGARWSFAAGPFTVRVTGTEFDLGWEAATQTLELALHQGSVELSGPSFSRPRRVHKGEFVRVRLQEAPTEDEDAENGAMGTDQAALDDESTEQTESEQAESSDQGRQQEPGAESNTNPGSRKDLSRASAQELWALSQSARLGGQPELARDALLALRKHHGTRGQSAFLLGKIYADQLGRSSEAIRWFDTYLKEVPSGSLREQALGRLVELQAGSDAGRRAARSYLERYPRGSYANLARRSL